jgi:predicted AlkP superfamily phosphohydrolase/phosphomutase
VLLDSYEIVDRAMGMLLAEHARDDDAVLVVSDHGGGPVSTYVHAAKVLSEAGLLTFSSHGEAGSKAARSLKRRLWYRISPALRQAALRRIPKETRHQIARAVRNNQIDWSRTKAIPRDAGGGSGLSIDINRRDRFSEGPVETTDYLAVRHQVAELFAGITDPGTGEPVLSAVLTKEEVYGDDPPEDAPDLQLVPAPGVATHMGMDNTEALSRVAVGSHRREAIFVANTDLGFPDPIPIEDVLPTALRVCGYRMSSTDASIEDASSAEVEEVGYTEVEAAEIEARLRELGYIE